MRRLIVAGTTVLVGACAHSRDDTTEPPSGRPELTVTDAALAQFAARRGGWTFYRNNPSVLSRSLGSGHVEPQLRTQYNPRAATQLDATGRVRAGASFPDSSIIVKELSSGGVISTVAVMMKLSGSPQVSQGDWVWGYFNSAGGARISVNERGARCAGCHSSGIDYTRRNDSHP